MPLTLSKERMTTMTNSFFAAYLALGLAAMIILIAKAPSLKKWSAIATNFALAISALLPVSLVKLRVVENEGNVGLYAVIYFVCFFTGLLMFNWRWEKRN